MMLSPNQNSNTINRVIVLNLKRISQVYIRGVLNIWTRCNSKWVFLCVEIDEKGFKNLCLGLEWIPWQHVFYLSMLSFEFRLVFENLFTANRFNKTKFISCHRLQLIFYGFNPFIRVKNWFNLTERDWIIF